MTSIASRRDTARRLAAPTLLAGLLPLLAGPVQAHPLYDTTHVLRQQGNDCVGATAATSWKPSI